MHPTDGELMGIIDEWTDPTGQPELERHVKICELCQTRQAALERDRLAVEALLGALESPAPARAVESIVHRSRRRNDRRRFVAAVAALFVATAAAATIRAGGVHEIFGPLTAARAPVAAPAPRPSQAAEAPIGVALEPASDVKIEFAAAQVKGELRIAADESPRVTVTATEPVPYTVRSGAVWLENKGSRASYRVTLPKALARATILVAGRVVFSKKGSSIVTEALRIGDGFSLPLASPGPTR